MWLGVFLSPLNETLVHHRVYTQQWSYWYPFIHLGGERHCESKVSCSTTQRNEPAQGLNTNHLIKSPAPYPLGLHPCHNDIVMSQALLYAQKKNYCRLDFRRSLVSQISIHNTKFPRKHRKCILFLNHGLYTDFVTDLPALWGWGCVFWVCSHFCRTCALQCSTTVISNIAT